MEYNIFLSIPLKICVFFLRGKNKILYFVGKNRSGITLQSHMEHNIQLSQRSQSFRREYLSVMTGNRICICATGRSGWDDGVNVRLKQITAQDGNIINLNLLNQSPEYNDFTLHLSDARRLFNVVQVMPKNAS